MIREEWVAKPSRHSGREPFNADVKDTCLEHSDDGEEKPTAVRSAAEIFGYVGMERDSC